MHFLIEAKSLLSSPGKMIGEQYKIIGIAQAETIRHKRDLWTFIERSLRIKKRYFKTFSKDGINVSGSGQVRVEMYTKILDCLLSRLCFTVDEGERELGGSVCGIKEAFRTLSLVDEKSVVSFFR